MKSTMLGRYTSSRRVANLNRAVCTKYGGSVGRVPDRLYIAPVFVRNMIVVQTFRHSVFNFPTDEVDCRVPYSLFPPLYPEKHLHNQTHEHSHQNQIA